MATKIGLGVPMPLLAPATATWAAPFAAYYVFLQNRIVYHRLKTSTYVCPILPLLLRSAEEVAANFDPLNARYAGFPRRDGIVRPIVNFAVNFAHHTHLFCPI